MIKRDGIRQIISYVSSKTPSTSRGYLHINQSADQAKRCIKDYNPIAHRPAGKLRKTIWPRVYCLPLITRRKPFNKHLLS
jgi:hypothetical protein